MNKQTALSSRFYWSAVASALLIFTACSFSDMALWTSAYGVGSYVDKIYAAIAWTGTFAFLLFLFTHIDGWKRCLISLRAEITKASRFIYIYVAYAVIVFGALIAVFAGDKFAKEYGVAGNLPNGYSYAVLAVFCNLEILLLFILGFTCHIVASEYSDGTLTTCLIRPIRRWEFLAGKMLAIIIFILSSILLSMGVAILCSAMDHPLGNIYVDSFMKLQMGEIIQNLAIFVGMILLMLFASASMAFLLSHLAKSVGGAILATAAAYVILCFLDIFFSENEMHFFTGADNFASTQTMNMAAAISYHWLPEALSYVYSCLAYIYVFCGLGCYLFVRRDIHGRG